MLYISGRERGIDRFYVHMTDLVKRAIHAVYWHHIATRWGTSADDRHCFIRSRAECRAQDAEPSMSDAIRGFHTSCTYAAVAL
jgi:hypothetical protein